jgi:23S rRNA U2552 (ribose-2'-O)-methylase RlmE/FtsJ
MPKIFDNKVVVLSYKTVDHCHKIKLMPSDFLYEIPYYQNLIIKRAEMNYYKRIMDTKPSSVFCLGCDRQTQGALLSWDKLSYLLDPYKNLRRVIRENYNAELCSNAWLKMYELLNIVSDLTPPNKDKIKSFHLCEAPGAFISALNHFLANKNQELEWYAQTLKPTNNNAAIEDTYGLINAYPTRWIFGDPEVDDSGDITHSKIIKYYSRLPELQELDLITSDAGLQCDPRQLNEQETHLSKINMGQIVCILACLPVGKNAIFKTFLPMSEPLTISLIYLVTQLFENVSVTKPLTSRCTNSEIYIVLKKYKGIKKELLNILYGILDDPNITSKSLLFQHIESKFFKTYTEINCTLMDKQIHALQNSYYHYYHFAPTTNEQKDLDLWFGKNPIKYLNRKLIS